MGFEDQLKRVFDAALAELTALSAAERDAARKEGLDRGRTLGWEDGLEQGRFEGRQAAEEEGRAAVEAAVARSRAEVAADQAAIERLVDAMRAMDRSRTLAETLDTLAGCAAREAARAGVLLVRGDRLQVFRWVGFDDANQEFPLETSGVIASAIRSRATASTETGGASTPPSFARLDSTHACLAVPITVGGEAVAVLYADQQGSPHAANISSWPEQLEVLTRYAAKCVETLTAMMAARALAGSVSAGPHLQMT